MYKIDLYLYSRDDRVCGETCNYFRLSLKVSRIVAQKSGKLSIYTIVKFFNASKLRKHLSNFS